MQLFEVRLKNTVEDSSYLFSAEDYMAAAVAYLKAMRAEDISVEMDVDDLEPDDWFMVRAYPAPGADAKLHSWDDIPEFSVRAQTIMLRCAAELMEEARVAPSSTDDPQP